MSPAVEQTLAPHREVEVAVGPYRSGRPAVESFIMDAAPATAHSRQDDAAVRVDTLRPAPKAKRSSYDLQRQYQDAMDSAHDIITPTADQHHVDGQAPVLPPKSTLRASRLLAGLKISPSAAEPLEIARTHHEEYLSSEEDASSTSGDFSDFEYDSSSDGVPSPAKRCSSSHVTARVVSVIYSGKPSVIDVPQVRRSISPIDRPSSTGGLSEKSCSSSPVPKSRRTSASTAALFRSSTEGLPPPRPPQARSRSGMQLDATKSRLAFLRVDPFANGSSYSLSPTATGPVDTQERKSAEDLEPPKTPKSPGRVSMFKGVARAMSLMKKRSSSRMSMPSLAPIDGEAFPRPASPRSVGEESAEVRRLDEVAQRTREPECEVAVLPSTPTFPPPRPQLRPAVTHDELIRMAQSNEQVKMLGAARPFHADMLESPISPMSPLAKDMACSTPQSRRMSSFGFGRRRMSLKAGVKLQL